MGILQMELDKAMYETGAVYRKFNFIMKMNLKNINLNGIVFMKKFFMEKDLSEIYIC